MSDDQTKLKAYCVALTFDTGPIAVSVAIAPNIESAAALIGIDAGRQHEGSATGIATLEVTPEWLRMALRSIESGKPTGDVVSLVSSNPSTKQAAPSWAAKLRADAQADAQQLRCPTHPDAPQLNGRCPLCQPTTGGAA